MENKKKFESIKFIGEFFKNIIDIRLNINITDNITQIGLHG